MGETQRLLTNRMKEHRDEVGKRGYGMPFTRGNRKAPEIGRPKSAITDHDVNETYLMDLDSAKIVLKESDCRTRGIKESTVIGKNPQNINRDEGKHFISYLYDDLLPDVPNPKCPHTFKA